MKRSGLLPYLVIITLCMLGAAAQQLPQPPPPHALLLNGSALVPVRTLATGIGATISLEATTGKVTLIRDDIKLILTPYDTLAHINQPVRLPVPPLLRAGHLFVPARAVAEAFSATVAWRNGSAQDTATRMAVVYQGTTTTFRVVEAGRVVTADLTGDAQAATACAVANVPGIDAYNSPYLSDIVPLEVWAVQGTHTLWRTALATGVSVSRFDALDLTGDRSSELLLTYFTRHSYMGPYPGSTYTVNALGWNGRTVVRILTLEYSRDHGHLYTEPATLGKAAAFILVDTNWKQHDDASHYLAELYAWNGRRFSLAERRVTRRPIPSETAARRLLGLIE